MKTVINGLQITNIEIRENCRKTHGKSGALKEAFKIIEEKYNSCVDLDVNKEATFNLCLTLDREF